LGPDKPSIGMGFRGMDRHTNVPSNTLTQRVIQNEEGTYLKLPSGELFRVIQISGEDGNSYQVIEASDWVALARDWAKNPGKLRKPARDGLSTFWPGSRLRASMPRRTPSSSVSTREMTASGFIPGSCQGKLVSPPALNGAGRCRRKTHEVAMATGQTMFTGAYSVWMRPP
jgi:hypothetical protein